MKLGLGWLRQQARFFRQRECMTSVSKNQLTLAQTIDSTMSPVFHQSARKQPPV